MTAAAVATHSDHVRDAGPSSDAPIGPEDLWRLNTGWEQDPEEWRERRQRQERLHRQTEDIAQKLEAVGFRVRQDQGDVTDLALVTGQTDRSEAYRSMCFLPAIAQRERRPILNQLRYYQKHDGQGRYMRYAVVTSGERVPVHDRVSWMTEIRWRPPHFRVREQKLAHGQGARCPFDPSAPSCPVEYVPGRWERIVRPGPLRDRIQDLHRRVSKFAHQADRHFGVEVLARVTEMPSGYDDAGVLSLHVHANLIYRPRKMLPAHRWRAFLRWAWRFWGTHWQDCGRLEKPDEVLKYPFKPEDTDELDGWCLSWLHKETAGLKMVQPMGDFRRFCRNLRDQGEKVATVNRPGGPRLEVVCKATRDGDEPKPGPDPDSALSDENRILCVTAPQFRHCPYAEPVVRVLNYTTEPRTTEGHERLQELRERQDQARQWWDANGAPDPAVALATGHGRAAADAGAAAGVLPFRVHTGRPTVREGSPSGVDPPRPEPPSAGADGAERAPDGTRYNPETGEILEPVEPGHDRGTSWRVIDGGQ